MSYHVTWVLKTDPAILKVLKRIPKRDATAIFKVIKLLSVNPYFGDIEKVKAEANTWRRRVGSYRIFFKIYVKEKIILVFNLERRTSKTY